MPTENSSINDFDITTASDVDYVTVVDSVSTGFGDGPGLPSANTSQLVEIMMGMVCNVSGEEPIEYRLHYGNSYSSVPNVAILTVNPMETVVFITKESPAYYMDRNWYHKASAAGLVSTFTYKRHIQ
jgi:hypothetical protein